MRGPSSIGALSIVVVAGGGCGASTTSEEKLSSATGAGVATIGASEAGPVSGARGTISPSLVVHDSIARTPTTKLALERDRIARSVIGPRDHGQISGRTAPRVRRDRRRRGASPTGSPP